MGFTWIFGYIATFTGIEALWYVFIILNSSQGFFIFLANTCNKRVYKCYKQALCGRGNRVQPEIAIAHPARQQQHLRPPIEQEGRSLMAEAISEGHERARIKEADYQALPGPSGYCDPPSASHEGHSAGVFLNVCDRAQRSLVFPGDGDDTKKTTSSTL